MHFLLRTSLLAAVAAATPYVKNTHNDVSYKGTSANGVEQFRNIFFAEDTSGKNRFEPPVPYFPPAGTEVDATEQGAGCPQATPGAIPAMSDVPYQSENCLTLRIARPAAMPRKKLLPVMVYIYGGGSILGEAYDDFFTPDGIIKQAEANGEPVLYAAMNYRVGVFGFAASKSLTAAKKANIGLRDQYLALEWIRDNIAHFGGDPSKITLFGQSFGGISTGLHLTAYGGERPPLFHKAIMTSGAISGDRSDKFTIFSTLTVADELKCTKTPGVVDEAAIQCMKDLPIDVINPAQLKVATALKGGFGFAAYPPVVDGDFIPEQPDYLLAKGKFLKDIPLIVTWARDDGSLSADASISTDEGVIDSFKSSFPDYTPELGAKMLSLYPLSDFVDQAASTTPKASPQYYRASRIQRDIDPACPLLTVARTLAHAGESQVYVGELNETRLTGYWDTWGMPLGVSHLSDVPYFFNEKVPPPASNTAHDMALSANYSGSFIHFANTGNPVAKGKTTFQSWPRAYGKSGDQFKALVIGGPFFGVQDSAPSAAAAVADGQESYGSGSSRISVSISRGRQILLDAVVRTGSFATKAFGKVNSAPAVQQQQEPVFAQSVNKLGDERMAERCKFIYENRI